MSFCDCRTVEGVGMGFLPSNFAGAGPYRTVDNPESEIDFPHLLNVVVGRGY